MKEILFFSSKVNSFFTSAFYYPAPSWAGKGVLSGHLVCPSWVTKDFFTTISLKSGLKLPSLVIKSNNLTILFEYREELYPDNLEGKSVYPIIVTPF